MHYYKEYENLAWEMVKGNPKVVIVFLLSFNHLSLRAL